MIDLKGKVALVTGGSRGLGRADCLALARAGADVVVTDILIESDPELEKTAEASQSVLSQAMASQKSVYSEKTSTEIREMGRRSVALKMDVTNREQVKAVVDQVVSEFGSLDILINNAGTLDHMASVDNQVDALWDRDLKVNLTGAFNCSKAVWPHMKQKKLGPHHHDVVHRRRAGRLRPGELRDDESRAGRSRPDARPGGRALQHHLQRDRPGRDRDGSLQDGAAGHERADGQAHRHAPPGRA